MVSGLHGNGVIRNIARGMVGPEGIVCIFPSRRQGQDSSAKDFPILLSWRMCSDGAPIARRLPLRCRFEPSTSIKFGPDLPAWTENSEANLIRRQKQSVETQHQHSPFVPKCFVLCERSSGAVRFHVEADPDGCLPVEKIASLLAVHCLVRGQAPEDYELMVIPRVSLLDAAAVRAQELLAMGRALGAGVKISRREREVLDGILENLANKEIASRLNVSERTVKFHVSSLLAKFGVTDRVALGREASLGRMPVPSSSGPPLSQSLFGYPIPPNQIPTEGEGNSASAESVPRPPREIHHRTRNRSMATMFTRERFAT